MAEAQHIIMVNQEGQGRTGTRGQGDLQRPTPNDPLPPVLLHLLSLLKVPEPPKIAPPAGQSSIQPRGTQIQTIAASAFRIRCCLTDYTDASLPSSDAGEPAALASLLVGQPELQESGWRPRARRI